MYSGCVHGVSLANAVGFVTDSLVNVFPYVIGISGNTCGFVGCLRGSELTVYLASRIDTEAGEAKLKFVCVMLAALPCVAFEFPVHIS